MIPTRSIKTLCQLPLLLAIALSFAGCRGAPTLDVAGSYATIPPDALQTLVVETEFPERSCTVEFDGPGGPVSCSVYSKPSGVTFVDAPVIEFPDWTYRFQAFPSDDPAIAERLVLVGFIIDGVLQELEPEDQVHFWRL